MQIRDIFATKVEERIEAVVKVADHTPAVIYNELTNLVITPQWERYLSQIIEEYTDAFEREDAQSIGIWISGFFGSGKSLLMKVLGMLLQGGEIQGESIHTLFLNRLPADSTAKSDLERLLAICQRRIATAFVGGNLHAQQAQSDEPLTIIAFKLFAKERGYTNNWSLAWAVEYHIDSQGLTADFQRIACELSGQPWSKLAADSDFHFGQLAKAAIQVLPNHFDNIAAVELAVVLAHQNGITPDMLVDRLTKWCVQQDKGGRRQKLLLQLDELGQWLTSGNDPRGRSQQVQALAESTVTYGRGRLWLAITAHGDIQELKHNAGQETFAKINQRFGLQCKLSNEDIDQVVQQRLLRKKGEADTRLRQIFQSKSGEISDIGSIQNSGRVYPKPDAANIAQSYPYLPWTIAVIPDVMRGIAQAINREEALIGANRTMIAVVQGGILDTPELLDRPIGHLIPLADLYRQLEDTIPIETKTDLNRISKTVTGATEFTKRVAYALFLLGKAEHIPCTLDNIVRALVTTFDVTLSELRPKVGNELQHLVQAGYVKQVGDIYVFLSTQQRSFQDRVRQYQNKLLENNWELSQKLSAYDEKGMFQFELVPFPGIAGSQKQLRLEIDGRVKRSTTGAPVTIHVYTSLYRITDPDIADDVRLKLKSNQEPNNLFLRLAEVPGFRNALALAAATEDAIDRVINEGMGDAAEKEVARKVQQRDVQLLQSAVLRMLSESVRNARLFFRNTDYDLTNGDGPADKVRNTISQLLPQIFSRFSEVPHKVLNPESAVKAALNANTSNIDLQTLGVYKTDGTLNEAHPLISTLRGKIPPEGSDEGTIGADQLRQIVLQPPFGWDANCVSIGLALLLRNSSCCLQIDSRLLTDPQSDEVLQVLTKELRFKNLRVQGIRSTLDTKELMEIRRVLTTIFNIKPQLVATTMNTALGEELKKLSTDSQTLSIWAATAHCPFPLNFDAGKSLIEEFLQSPAPTVRLPQFQREWEKVQHFVTLLQQLQQFKNEHGDEYTRVERFFHSMINLDGAPGEVRAFIERWHVVANERSFTEAAHWGQLMQLYHAAQQSLTNQAEAIMKEIQSELHQLEADLPKRLLEASVPAEAIESEVKLIAAELQSVHQQLQSVDLSFTQTRMLRSSLPQTRLKIQKQVSDARARYQTIDDETSTQPQEVYLNWHSLFGASVRISSVSDLDQLLNRIKHNILTELEQQRVVIVE